MTTQRIETEFVEYLRPQFEAEGFQFYVAPPRSLLPKFLESYRPDAIALKPEKKIAIEIINEGRKADSKISKIKELFPKGGEWELRVFYTPRPISPTSLTVAPNSAIDLGIRDINTLRNAGQLRAALVMAWATLEAIARATLPEKLSYSQSPVRLIDAMASEGILTPGEADELRSMIHLRNAIVHGQIDSEVDAKALDDFIGLLQRLARFLERHHEKAV